MHEEDLEKLAEYREITKRQNEHYKKITKLGINATAQDYLRVMGDDSSLEASPENFSQAQSHYMNNLNRATRLEEDLIAAGMDLSELLKINI